MEGKKIVGMVSLVVGITILIVALAADVIRPTGWTGFGTYQILGTIVGALVIVVALSLTFRK